MLDTSLRQIEILKSLPRYPRKIAASDILTKMKEAGHDVSIRTIQRDLIALSGVFAITGDEQKPQGWSWAGDPIQIPSLDPQGALTLHLAQQYLSQLLPKTTLNALEPHFQAAQSVLSASPNLARWTNKVRVIPTGLSLKAPQIDEQVQSVVYESLLHEKQIRIQYRRKGETELKEYTVHPLGLVIRNQLVYLICTIWKYEAALQLALHRITDATMTEERALRPKGFDLDAYINKGEFGYLVSDAPIRLRVLLEEGAALHLHETPISTDQTLTPQKDGRELLEATVLDTSELRWWLLGFGSAVEIRAPRKLRKEFRSIAQEMAALYK